MNRETFLRYLKKKENTSEDNEDITITNVVISVTKDITNAKLSFAAEKIKNHTVDLSSARSKSQKMLKGKLESMNQYLELPLPLKSFH